jgi:signal transduction histidine kinase
MLASSSERMTDRRSVATFLVVSRKSSAVGAIARRPDAWAALVLFVVTLLAIVVAIPANRRVEVVGVLALSWAAMAWVRKAPIAVGVVAFASTVFLQQFGITNQLVLVWVLYVLGRLASRARVVAAAVLCVATSAMISLGASTTDDSLAKTATTAVASAAFFAMPFALGRIGALRARRALEEVRSLEQQNAIDRQQLELAVTRQREQLARELHDSVAHAMSVVALHASAAAESLRHDNDAGTAQQSLAIIESTARASLAEMRQVVTALRTPNDDVASLTPPPDLAQIRSLVDSHRDATLTVQGRSVCSPAVSTSLFRIVQEALTNASRHAPDARADVVVEHGPRSVIISVTNPHTVPRSTSETRGFGIVGMRERIGALGGTIDVGPTPSGEWLVRAVVPIQR